MRRSIDQPATGDKSRWLCEPGWIPEGGNFPFGLIASSSSTIEAIEGGGAEEEGT